MVPDSPCPPRPRQRSAFALLACLGLLAGCAPHAGHEMLNAVLWHQRSAEYRALALQSYALATGRLHEALASPRWSAALEQHGDPSGLAPAVILDLDETVFDNARYEARIVLDLGEYSPRSFAEWCESGDAAAVPGAVAFISTARSLGVRVFYYSARQEALRGCTERGLRSIGLAPVEPGTVFLRGAGSKSEVRAALAREHRILLLVGDNLEDFVDGSKAQPEAREEIVRRHAAWFGERWIVLPNAMYGHWESTYYRFDHATPRAEKLERKSTALEP